MARHSIAMGLVLGTFVATLGLAAPALAQQGGLFGKVFNEKGEPVAGAEIIFENEDAMMTITGTVTNAKGEWFRGGLRSGQGTWSVQAKKDGISAGIKDVIVRLNQQSEVPDLVLRAPAPPTSFGSATVGANLGSEAAEARKALITEVQKLFTDATALADANNTAGAIAKMTEATTKMPDCDLCFLKLGELHLQAKDAASAEKAYLAAIALNSQSKDAAQAYMALTTIYNDQKRYDEARQASEKAAALSGGTAGGDPVAEFNAGVVLLNQNKMAEARPHFERAVALDPKMAEARYWLAMAYANEGKLDEAKAAAAEYLKLAPNGEFAEIAKELVK